MQGSNNEAMGSNRGMQAFDIGLRIRAGMYLLMGKQGMLWFGSWTSSQNPCVKLLDSSLWHCWQLVGPVDCGIWWKALDHWGCALQGNIWTLASPLPFFLTVTKSTTSSATHSHHDVRKQHSSTTMVWSLWTCEIKQVSFFEVWCRIVCLTM